MDRSTFDQSWPVKGGHGDLPASPRPGLVVLFRGGRAVLDVFPMGAVELVLGRSSSCDVPLDDDRCSRRHAEIALDGDRWTIRDLGSHNGTFVHGDPRRTTWPVESPGTLAIGDTIALLLPDVNAVDGGRVEVDRDVVLGPRLQAVWQAIARAASAETLHISGETGTGKELAARRFHEVRAARHDGPFIAVNCAAIPPALAERLLFGARRGVYSGADADSEGYLGAAHRGTLFLDELAELPLDVQAKLLRAVETREVLALGAATARPVSIAICSASHGELRARITDGRFRDDLFFRLCQNEVRLPPLRERLEEIPWHLEAALRREARTAHASLVEAALRRPWPGNVRELLGAIATATRTADGDGPVRAEHLPPPAGGDVLPSADVPTTATATATDDEIIAALKREEGNVQAAARALGLHRNQLRRWLARKRFDPQRFRPGDK